MKVVVDSNLVISAILNQTGKIGQLLIFGQRHFEFYSPNLVKTEVKKNKHKLLHLSEMSDEDFDEIRDEIFECINFISEEQVPYDYWHKAIPVVRDIDMDDIAFVAMSDYIDSRLWTGDKRLLEGIRKKGYQRGISTDELYQIWINLEDE